MSVWVDEGPVAVRRSSRRLSITPSDAESVTSQLSTPSTGSTDTPRKLLRLKNSMIPRLNQIDERMASSDEELYFATEPRKSRGRPRKDGTPAQAKGTPFQPRSTSKKMTAIKTPAPSAAAVKAAAAAAAATPATTTKVKIEPTTKVKIEPKTEPRSRSSSRTRRASGAVSTPSGSPVKQPKIAPLNFDDDFNGSPVLTRRSTRLATKTPAVATNCHATNGSAGSHHTDDETTPAVSRFSSEKFYASFSAKYPIIAKYFIPAMICLVYALVIIGVAFYFDLHRKVPVWADQVAQQINDIYDDFQASRAAAKAAAAATADKI